MEPVRELTMASSYLRVLRQARVFWPQLAGIAALSMISAPLALLLPLPVKIAVDSVLGSGPLPRWLAWMVHDASTSSALVTAVGLLLAIAVINQVQALMAWYLQTCTAEGLVWDFRAQLLRHVQRLPMSFHDRAGAYDLAYRIQNDAASIQYIVIQGIIPVFTATCTLAAMLYVSVCMDLKLAWIAISIAPVLALLTRKCSSIVRQRSMTVKQLDSSAIAVVQEVLASIRVVKAFGQQEREEKRFVGQSNSRVRNQIKLATVQGWFNLLIGLTIALGSAGVLYVGVRHVHRGILTVGDLLVIIAYIAQMYEPLRLISTRTADLQSWIVSVDRAFDLLQERTEIEEAIVPRALGRAEGDVEFRNVSFTYNNGRSGLRDISLSIPHGSRVGVIGTTGAGKTTMIHMLMRFYDPSEGEVRLDGVDLRDYRIADLRRQFAVVLQEPVLFNISIAENIAYGNPNASEEEIFAAAQAAHCHDFILRQPQAYATVIGERGDRLSGGERQRIALARAFLRDAPILILDEPTSSIDVATETEIMRATEELMRGRTTFMIAHRLSTLRLCDMVVRLEQGRVVEITHRMTTELLPETQTTSKTLSLQ
ncbi:MAG: ABC transporter ATP-binding protein [Terriglobales bacterium]|jgi:ATP-binding cassette subfamily B protein